MVKLQRPARTQVAQIDGEVRRQVAEGTLTCDRRWLEIVGGVRALSDASVTALRGSRDGAAIVAVHRRGSRGSAAG
nr:unnamed protein product [Digitaria exilis]